MPNNNGLIKSGDYVAEAVKRFGSDPADWKFVCPACGRVNSGKEFKEAGCEPNDMWQNCIGRYDKSKGCNWAAYGLFDVCKVHIEFPDGHVSPAFEIADPSWEVGSIHKEGSQNA